MKNKYVSVIIPVYNEEPYLTDLLKSLEKQTYPKESFEVLFVIDDNTSDQSENLIKNSNLNNLTIKTIRQKNKKTVPVLLNLGVKESNGEIIVRLDAHAIYPSNYIEKCVEFLEKTQADNVGGPIISKGVGYWGQAIAVALSSIFGVGNSLFRVSNYEGSVDTVPFGAWRKSTFDKFGLFDESLKRNQDDEFNFRIIKNGGKVFMTPEIKSEYFVRQNLSKLWHQYWQFGYFKTKVIQKHRSLPSLRALIPSIFLSNLILFIALSLFNIWFLKIFNLLLLVYTIVLVFGSILTSLKNKTFKFIFILPIIFAVIHFSYGAGFLKGVCDFIFRIKIHE